MGYVTRAIRKPKSDDQTCGKWDFKNSLKLVVDTYYC
jgi:hypothetical protein